MSYREIPYMEYIYRETIREVNTDYLPLEILFLLEVLGLVLLEVHLLLEVLVLLEVLILHEVLPLKVLVLVYFLVSPKLLGVLG